jgi:hypothetical protein
MAKDDKFVALDSSGRAENYKEGSTWWSILEDCYLRLQHSDGNRPMKLLRNGVVVSTDIDDIGYKYSTALRKAIDAARESVRQQFPEPWDS